MNTTLGNQAPRQELTVRCTSPGPGRAGQGHRHEADLARRAGVSRSLSLLLHEARLASWGRLSSAS